MPAASRYDRLGAARGGAGGDEDVRGERTATARTQLRSPDRLRYRHRVERSCEDDTDRRGRSAIWRTPSGRPGSSEACVCAPRTWPSRSPVSRRRRDAAEFHSRRKLADLFLGALLERGEAERVCRPRRGPSWRGSGSVSRVRATRVNEQSLRPDAVYVQHNSVDAATSRSRRRRSFRDPSCRGEAADRGDRCADLEAVTQGKERAMQVHLFRGVAVVFRAPRIPKERTCPVATAPGRVQIGRDEAASDGGIDVNECRPTSQRTASTSPTPMSESPPGGKLSGRGYRPAVTARRPGSGR